MRSGGGCVGGEEEKEKHANDTHSVENHLGLISRETLFPTILPTILTILAKTTRGGLVPGTVGLDVVVVIGGDWDKWGVIVISDCLVEMIIGVVDIVIIGASWIHFAPTTIEKDPSGIPPSEWSVQLVWISWGMWIWGMGRGMNST